MIFLAEALPDIGVNLVQWVPVVVARWFGIVAKVVGLMFAAVIVWKMVRQCSLDDMYIHRREPASPEEIRRKFLRMDRSQMKGRWILSRRLPPQKKRKYKPPWSRMPWEEHYY